MCDPISVAVGAIGGLVASKALAPKTPTSSVVPQADPAAERAAAEAEAQQSANRRLAEDQRRRRQQGSLIAQGAPQPTLGDTTNLDPNAAQSPLGGPVSRGRVNPGMRPSLMSSVGAPVGGGPLSPGGAGGGRFTTQAF